MEREQAKYDKISTEMRKLLSEAGECLGRIAKLNNTLLGEQIFNLNPDFLEYISCFNMGMQYELKANGFVECLTETKCYQAESLCYFKNKLVLAAAGYFMDALKYFERIRSQGKLSENVVYRKIESEINAIKKTAFGVMGALNRYNLPC